ncbi:helix-turn-helix domain-containing protein [Micromonospora sp. Mcm103]|uniref:helix-turn-helix domain-containing protein n=1 Tax=Micromonospora sp. Mcm103 TaxID=2926015 RepID=UPI0021C5C5CA|nr:helix-turn-helix transcriptional regulator [Micromonospora sp. Mcm103]
MTNEPVAAWPLSEVAAQQINRLRRSAGLTREQLAAACQAVGGPESLSASAIANIETGRPDKTGRRRRDLTVEELVIFARALGVPPLLLLFPFDRFREVEVLPGSVVPTWDAAQWFAGRGPFPSSMDRIGEWQAHQDVFERGAVPFELWQDHARIRQDWSTKTGQADLARRQAANADSEAQRDSLLRDARGAELDADRLANALWELRRRMRQHGVLTPELPESLAHVDTDRSPLEQAIAQAYVDPARPWRAEEER